MRFDRSDIVSTLVLYHCTDTMSIRSLVKYAQKMPARCGRFRRGDGARDMARDGARCVLRVEERFEAANPKAAAPKKNYPASAVRRYFFTRRSGRAETCGRLLPSPGDQRSGAWHPRKPTRNPFLNLWVKAQAWRTPQDNHWRYYSRRARHCQRGTGRFSRNCKI